MAVKSVDVFGMFMWSFLRDAPCVLSVGLFDDSSALFVIIGVMSMVFFLFALVCFLIVQISSVFVFNTGAFF
jgi:hypothetical protein